MLYFIPAWYQENKWCENEQNWHARRQRSEFDDTVKHIQLFHRSGAYPFKIMLLSFAPNFRHFLHRQSVFHAQYWSCFDGIQEVRRKKIRMLSFHNLNWPSDIEFVYTPFVVVALLKGEKYAQIEFGEDGNPIQIDMYQNGDIQRRNLYDDRGFVASTIIYENRKPVYQDYLTEKGLWKMRFYYQDGRVEINAKSPQYLLQYGEIEQMKNFSKLHYENIEQVISEVLTSYLNLTEEKDIFCVAMHELHTQVLKKALHNRKKILSFFEDRFNVQNNSQHLDLIEEANYIITDSQENIRHVIRGYGSNMVPIKDITPFDSREDFGISLQLHVQKILVPVDGMEESRFEQLISYLGQYLPENENVRIHLFTRMANYDRKSKLLELTRKCLAKAGLEEEWAEEEHSGNMTENNLDDVDTVPIRFFVEQCVDELSVSKCIREQRLIVDMRNTTEVYLRIAGLSVGIPQIVYAKTQFVEHKKNGLVLQELKYLSEAIRFYLDSMTNWNEAMVYSYELGKKYTTSVLLKEWKEVIEFVGQD